MLRPRLAPFLFAALLPAVAAAQDPFTSSQRWSAGPNATTAWIPDDAVFAGDDAFVWTALDGGSQALHLYDTVDSGTAAPRGVVPRLAGQYGAALVAAGSRGDSVFALRQFESPTVYRRAPLVSGFDPRTASGGAAISSTWTHDMGVRINGPARLAADGRGALVAAAVWNDTNAHVRVDLLDGSDGSLVGRADLPAIGLGAIAVSADGTRVIVSSGMTLYVLDGAANVLHTEALGAATQAIGLSSDGGTILYGDFGRAHVLIEFPGVGHLPFGEIAGAANELPGRLALSPDGATAAIGWWNYTTGRAARLEMVDVVIQFPLASFDLPAPPNGSQNFVSSVDISADGRRAAFGTWGNSRDPEVIVLDRDAFGPVMAIDLPGSARGVDLDTSGTRVAIAHKNVHSTTFGARGTVRLVDSGERRIQLLATPQLGGELVAAARYPGSSFGFFMLGPKAQTPTSFPGVTGQLLLDRGRVQVHARVPDANGRVDFSMPIGSNPGLRGVQLHFQGAFRTPQGLVLTSNLVSPYLLD